MLFLTLSPKRPTKRHSSNPGDLLGNLAEQTFEVIPIGTVFRVLVGMCNRVAAAGEGDITSVNRIHFIE